MTPRPSGELLERGLDFCTNIVRKFDDRDWARSTPCAGWSARDLLGHLWTSMAIAVDMMQGRQPTLPDVARPGDLVEGDPAEFWRDTTEQVRDVLRSADLARPMESPLGGTIADSLAIPVIDLYVHAWDLGTAVGIAVEIPEVLIDYAHSYIDPLPDGIMRGEGRAFATQTKSSADATPTEQFIAWTGRQPP
jgi:uncharacterized protein (TIGR03086 family)